MAMEVCRGQRFRAALTSRVVLEARVNIAEKFGEPQLLRFYHQMAGMDPEMVSRPSAERLAECAPLTSEKDAHVLAAALECRAAYLLTLDRRHLTTPTVQSAGLPMMVITPGDFLQQIVSGLKP